MRGSIVRISLIAIGLGVLGACDNSKTLVLDPDIATRISIDASRCPSVTRCGRCQLDFDAWDQNGQPVTILTVVWTSSNPAIATVDGAGRVDGWTTGIVKIDAEVLESGAADTVSVPVTPPASPSITCTPP